MNRAGAILCHFERVSYTARGINLQFLLNYCYDDFGDARFTENAIRYKNVNEEVLRFKRSQYFFAALTDDFFFIDTHHMLCNKIKEINL